MRIAHITISQLTHLYLQADLHLHCIAECVARRTDQKAVSGAFGRSIPAVQRDSIQLRGPAAAALVGPAHLLAKLQQGANVEPVAGTPPSGKRCIHKATHNI